MRVLTIVGLSLAVNAQRRNPTYASDSLFGTRGIKSFKQKSRTYVPYGVGTGYGFGMGAAEQGAYDHVEKYAYAVSEQGAINVVDFMDSKSPTVIPAFAIDLAGHKLTDIEVCPEQGLMIIGFGADDLVSNGGVRVYSTVKRSDQSAPALINEFEVGPLPDMVKPTHDCTMLAVGNEGEGKHDNYLDDPVGSLHLIKDFGTANPKIAQVFFDFGTDEELIAKGIHLPLPLNAMEYWDDHSDIADSVDFTEARAKYNPAMNFEPEYLGWASDYSKVYVSLQENNALVTVDVPAGDWNTNPPKATRIDAYGLKDWSSSGGCEGIDLVEDGTCILKNYDGFKALRSPDGIHMMNVNGEDYIVTGNEGDDKEYGDYAEKWKMKDLLKDGVLQLQGGSVTPQALANDNALNAAGASTSRRVTVGSSAIDYSNPQSPVLHDLVSIGGRGISIFKPTESGLELVWDSGSILEREGYAAYPWAHNSIQDEEYSPVNGIFYNVSDEDVKQTLREMNDPAEDGCEDGGDGRPGACPMGKTVDARSPKDGPSAEIVATGVACGRLLTVTAAEKNGLAYVFDISDFSKAKLFTVVSLSPASQNMNPGVAYEQGILGDIDSEQIIFLESQYSPSGNAGVLFGGAWSGTFSWWEFQCCTGDDDDDDGPCSDDLAPIVA